MFRGDRVESYLRRVMDAMEQRPSSWAATSTALDSSFSIALYAYAAGLGISPQEVRRKRGGLQTGALLAPEVRRPRSLLRMAHLLGEWRRRVAQGRELELLAIAAPPDSDEAQEPK